MIKIVFHADNDINSNAEAVNAAMVKENADLYCFIGDGPYSKSGTGWVRQQKKHFDDKKDKMIWSRGNHDEDESESKQTQKDMEEWFPEAKGVGISDCWLSSRQVGNVFVISMDTQDLDIEFKRDQYNWVKSELQKAKQLRTEGKIDWIVILFHKPAFTLKSSHSPYTALRFLYKDIWHDAQVDFAVNGHNHNTQLWYPMVPDQSQANGEGKQLFSYASDGKTFDFSKEHGIAYIVSGHSAHEWNEINDSGTGVKNVMHYRDSGKFGFTSIEFDGKKAKVFSKDVDNKTIYEYNVTREGTITNPPDNKPPIANAGPDQIVASKANVVLNGSASTDPDVGGTITSYQWKQVSGPTTVTLNNPNNAIASFTAPDIFAGEPTTPKWKFKSKWGSQGMGDGQFQNAEGIAIDADGNVYVSDWTRHDVQKFSPDGTFIRKFGTTGQSGPGNDQFFVPFTMRIDPRDGNLWIADQFNNRMKKINRNTGAYMTQIGPTIPGLPNPSTLDNPEDLDFDPVDFSMYIMDTNNRRIVKVDANGNYVTQWKTFENNFPEGMTVNPVTRNVYVTDYEIVRIHVYSPTGQPLFHFGEEGEGPGQLTNILERHAQDKIGRFYQLDSNTSPKVVVFDKDGKYITEFGSKGSGDGQFCDAEQLAVNNKDYKIYIADQCNYRIQVFEPEKPTTVIAFDDHLNQTLTFQLTVTDNKGAQASDSVLVTVAENPPIEPTPVEPTPVEPTPPEIKCPRNYELDPSLGYCIPKLEPSLEPDCGEGWKWNPTKKICERTSSTNPTPPEEPSIIDAAAPDIINAKVGETVILDGSHSTGPIVKAEWNRQDNSGIPIILEPETTNNKKWSYKFTATERMVNKEIKYILRVFNSQGTYNDDLPNGTKVIVKPAGTVEPTPVEPTPVEPTPPEDKVLLYDSNTHGKWNNGQKRTVTEGDGNTSPDGKGLHTAASGDPTLTIDGDGVAHLESSRWGRVYIYAKNYNFKLVGSFKFETDHGEADNISIKLRSRHGNNNHPQGGSNQFGGLGFAFHPSGEVEIKAEIQHGGSSFDFGNLQGPKLGLNEWHKYEISGFDENGGITVSVAIDDKNIGSKKWSNPHNTAVDKSSFAADSYFWIRLNCHDGDRAKAAIKDLKLYDLT